MSDQPGNAQFSNQPPPTIPDHLYLAIFSTICCGCLPLGIVAIVNSMNVKKYVAEGKYDLAEKASKSAKMWCFISIGVGVVLTGISVIAQIALGVLSNR